MTRGTQIGQRSERGVAILLCLFALLLLSAIGLSMAFMADTETAINRNYRDAQTAYFGATAGVQEAKERLLPVATDAIAAPSTLPSTSNTTGVVYIVNPDASGAAIQPWNSGNTYFDTELCHENFSGLGLTNTGVRTPCATAPSGTYYTSMTSSSPFQGTSSALTYKWVRVTQKVNSSAVPDGASANSYWVSGSTSTSTSVPICWNGSNEVPLPSGYANCDTTTPPGNGPLMHTVYRVTSLALGPSGSRRMVQAEMAQDPPFLPNAAVDSQDHVTLNGALFINGYDNCTCNCTTSGSGGNTTVSCTSRTGMTCDTSKYGIYASGSVDQTTGNETIVAGQNPPIAQDQNWPYDIMSLINRYANQPGTVNATGAPYNYSCVTSSTALNGLTCGTQTNQTLGIPPAFPPNPTTNPAADPSLGTPASQITYVPGNLQLSGGSVGNGILVVNGDLDIHGGLQFYGLIIVRGVIKFTGGGSDTTNIYGSVIAGQESLVDNTLGGSANIYFNKCAVTSAAGQSTSPLRQISFKEVMY